jgi:hypothetical protein
MNGRQSPAATIWGIVGVLVIMIIIGATINAYKQQQNPPSCPLGYSWNSTWQQCEYGTP